MFDRFSLKQRSLISSIAGFLFYGAWAFLVNSMHGPLVAGKAALVQGSYSFFITIGMTLTLEGVYHYLIKWTGRVWFCCWATVVVSCMPVFIGSWMVNVAAGTPEILKTVILGYVIGGVYCASYALGLSNQKNTKPNR